jgi:hypothetical protein
MIIEYTGGPTHRLWAITTNSASLGPTVLLMISMEAAIWAAAGYKNIGGYTMLRFRNPFNGGLYLNQTHVALSKKSYWLIILFKF